MALKQHHIPSFLALALASCGGGDLPPPDKATLEKAKRMEMKEKLKKARVEVENFGGGERLFSVY